MSNNIDSILEEIKKEIPKEELEILDEVLSNMSEEEIASLLDDAIDIISTEEGSSFFNDVPIVLSIEDLYEEKLSEEHPRGPKNSCLSWFGGKYKMRERLAALSPPDVFIKDYVECFGGAGHMIFYKHVDPKKKNVLNDLNKGIYTVFKVIKDDATFNRLAEKLSKTPYTEEVWRSCLDWEDREDEVELAWAFMVRHLQAINVSGGFAKPTEIRGKGEDAYFHNVHKFENKTGKYLHALKQKMDYITVENLDYKDCIDKYDNEDTFFLLDPPYVHSTRTAKKVYDHEMNDQNHQELIDKILSIKGYVLLCGYDNDIYKRLEENGFYKILVKRVKRSSSNVNRHLVKHEYVWVNYNVFDGILAYFVQEEAICSFACFGDLLKKGHFDINDMKECLTIDFKNASKNISATETKINKLEEKYSIKLPQSYKRALSEFNGGYFDKELSLKTYIKPLCLFGILNQDHPFDLETNIKKYPKIMKHGFMPIGVTMNGDILCIDTTKDIFAMVTLCDKNGDMFHLEDSYESFISTLFYEYRGYTED